MNDRMKISYGRTINLGNYESLKLELGIERDILDNEIKKEIIQNEFEIIEDEMEQLIKWEVKRLK